VIISALCDYYRRRLECSSESGEIVLGFEKLQVPNLIVIDRDGKFVRMDSTCDDKDKKGRRYLLPAKRSRSTNITPNYLYDSAQYILGVSLKKDEKPTPKKLESFIRSVSEIATAIGDTDGGAVAAIKSFYSTGGLDTLLASDCWRNEKLIDGWTSFILSDEPVPIPCMDKVASFLGGMISDEIDNTEGPSARCLATGKMAPIERTHGKVSVCGKNINLISFQKNQGLDFHDRSQGGNAPISKEAAKAYTGAINLLAKSKSNRIHIGETDILFWAADKNMEKMEEAIYGVISGPSSDNPDTGVKNLRSVFTAACGDYTPIADIDKRFYVLGLYAANQGRAAVRFWKNGTIRDIARNILRHFDDMSISNGKNDMTGDNIAHPSFARIKNAMMTRKERESKTKVSPDALMSSIVMSIFDGTSYPLAILEKILLVIHKDKCVTRDQAAIARGFVCRNQNKEVSMGLDTTVKCVGYCTGRLFAVYERLQFEASGNRKVSSDIADRYFPSIMDAPASTIEKISKESRYHQNKLNRDKKGRAIYFQKLIGSIYNHIDGRGGIPTRRTPEITASFIVGYHHQQQDFFVKKS